MIIKLNLGKKTMDFFLIEKTLKNEEGMVMIFSLMVLLILTIAGVAAINISNNETTIVRNEQLAASEFYEAETGINDARINYDNWLTDEFLSTSETSANSTFDSISTDDDGDPLATIQARCIEGTATPVFGTDNVADNIPAISHTDTPPDSSGYSVLSFEIRRYSITSTSNDGNTVAQTGVWKVFNKY